MLCERSGLSPAGPMTRLVRVALCGAMAGAVNAWLCYAGLPVPVIERNSSNFEWHVIPAGAVHGGVLAALVFGAAILASTRPIAFRMGAALPLGWLVGYISWIPLSRSALDRSWPESFFWALEDQDWTQVFAPFAYFGLVAVFYYVWLTARGLKTVHAWENVAGACAAGTLGSLWFWLIYEHWYFCVLHGVIWGVLVGLGAGGDRVKQGVA